MDGLNRLTAAAHTVSIGGRTYRFGPLVLRDYGEIENRILAARPDPVAVAMRNLAGLSESQQEFLLGRAYDRAVAAWRATADEFDRWRRSPEGFCYLFWIMVRKQQQDMTLEDAAELVELLADEARAELLRTVEKCSELPVGNRSSQAQPTATV